MKLYIKLSLLGLALFSLSSCDKEENPMYPRTPFCELIEQYHPSPSSIDCDSYPFPEFSPNTNTDRNLLIEDYTGHFCNNCPDAAIIAHDIEIANPNRAFAIAIHSGGPTDPFQGTSSSYPTDYTTQAGLDYTVDIPGFFGNPSGMLNRKYPSGGSSLWQFSTTWAAEAQAILDENKLVANVQVQTTLYPETNGLFVHYEVEAIENLDDNTKVIVLLVERKVVSAQTINDGTTDPDYEHHNVLSGAVNSSYGDAIGALSTGEKYTGVAINGLNKISKNRTVNADGGNDLSVVTMVVNGETHEIYQISFDDIAF